MTIPAHPKIYHIIHEDRLPSILAEEWLWCDATMATRNAAALGTTIGMRTIKQRRLTELTLTSYPNLHVGDCVPFYFCPRSIMLYLLYQSNHQDLNYRGGQGPIIHLEADLSRTVDWAQQNNLSWAFTLSNAGAYYFEDRSELRNLIEIDWTAVQARNWKNHKEGKQAEFLVERQFSWNLVERIGVHSITTQQKVQAMLQQSAHRPPVERIPSWYY